MTTDHKRAEARRWTLEVDERFSTYVHGSSICYDGLELRDGNDVDHSPNTPHVEVMPVAEHEDAVKRLAQKMDDESAALQSRLESYAKQAAVDHDRRKEAEIALAQSRKRELALIEREEKERQEYQDLIERRDYVINEERSLGHHMAARLREAIDIIDDYYQHEPDENERVRVFLSTSGGGSGEKP